MDYYFFLVLQCISSNKAPVQIYNRKSKPFFLRDLRDFRICEISANFLNQTLWVRQFTHRAPLVGNDRLKAPFSE
jgi:hypothetical protein